MTGNLKSKHEASPPSAEMILQVGSSVLNTPAKNTLLWIRDGELQESSGLLLKKDDMAGGEFLCSRQAAPSLTVRKEARVIPVSYQALMDSLQKMPVWLLAIFRDLVARLRRQQSPSPAEHNSDVLGALAFFLYQNGIRNDQKTADALDRFCWLTGAPSEKAAAALSTLTENGWISNSTPASSVILDVVARFRIHQQLHLRFAPFDLDATARALLTFWPDAIPLQTATESTWLSTLQKLNPQAQVGHLLRFKELGLWRVQGDGLISPCAETLEWYSCALLHQRELESLP